MRIQAVMPQQTGDYQMTVMNADGFIDMPPVSSRIPLAASDSSSGASGTLPNNWQDRHDVRARRGY